MTRTSVGKRPARVVSMSVPKLRSESEEADWWYQNRDAAEDFLIERGRRGDRNLELEIELKPKKLISIRPPETDIERTNKLAVRKGMAYQTYLHSLLHEGLAREERKSKVKTPGV
jgi:predicted DNA binding CopG/RHH family protein